MRLAPLILAVLLIASPLRAQTTAPAAQIGNGHSAMGNPIPYSFHPVVIGGGGYVTGLTFNTTAPFTLFARTDVGSAYRFDTASNSWTPLLDFVPRSNWNDWGISALATDPADPQRLYLAAGTYTRPNFANAHLYRSTDAGKTFAITDLPFKLGGNEDGRNSGPRLVIDPANPATLYLGTPNDGLFRSTDSAASFQPVESLPAKHKTNGVGIAFITLDAHSLYVGVSGSPADAAGIYRSTDNAKTFQLLPNQPQNLLVNHGELAPDGTLYLTYGNAPGPNNLTAGAVFSFNPATNAFTDISPVHPDARHPFGFGGLTFDPHHPATVIVATLDRWSTGDGIYRSTDAGQHWTEVAQSGTRDSSATPWITLGRPTADAGHWMTALALDPADPNHFLYGTGATIWETHDLTNADTGKPVHWKTAVAGFEETVCLDLLSPPGGPAHLLSAVGDIGGFLHTNLDASPPRLTPAFTNTTSLASDPTGKILARTGALRNGNGPHAAISTDFGATWSPLPSEPAGADQGGTLALSADASLFLWTTRTGTFLSTDHAASWSATTLPGRTLLAADPHNASRFFALDQAGELFASAADHTFLPTGFSIQRPTRLLADPITADSLFLSTRTQLLHSTDAGETFTPLALDLQQLDTFTLGPPIPPSTSVTLFLAGRVHNAHGIFRSTDLGQTFNPVTDPQHQFSNSSHLAADARIPGRLYIGTPGRGILYADPLPEQTR